MAQRHRLPVPTLPLAAFTLVPLLVVGCDSGEDTADPAATIESTGRATTRAPDSSSAVDESVAATVVDDDRGDDLSPARGLGLVPELVRRIEPSIVAVSVSSTAGPGGEGSGVIIRSDGLVVTNNHVVDNAVDVAVVLADGTRLPATIEATDVFTDLALLRIDRDDLPAAELAADYPEIGELAVALGNPLGFENTVTAGIISGLGRAIPAGAVRGGQSLVDLVQTDAAISPGNSGGALVDAEGRVVGINVAYIPPAVGAVSLGFAIPSPTVIDVIDELLADGTAEHAYLGVQLSTVTDMMADQLSVEVGRGVAVIAAEPGTPAQRAGLEPGDVIVEVDDNSIADLSGFLTVLRRFDPGDTVELSVVRDGETMTVDVQLTERPID
ncbi:MAG: trypsin-like peptidase domain-containing protein [Ilumatobacteraceae bacterium]|nr:trypsin-like peptidase domain-containing protein [Ilumatobacteraceae bacterium]